ncbi:MAG: hypothetical protein QXT26_01040 [Thermoproteota archaeon]
MNTVTKRLSYVKTLLLVVILTLLINPGLQRALGGPELSIPLYKSPKIDGTISKNEYPVTQLDTAWGKLYAVHDESNIIFGIVLANECIRVELLFNTGSLEATTLSVSTLRYSINRSGSIEYYYGSGGRWVSSPVGGVSLKVVNKTTTWVIELSVPLSSITISPNTERKLGFALIAYEKTTSYCWPPGTSLYNPSSWGIISSPDNWATKNDICLEVFLDKDRLIAGSNLTFIAVITNRGDAPIPDYHIRIWFDDRLIEDSRGSSLGLKTPLEKTDRIEYKKKILNAPVGNHTIKANVTGVGVYYDSDTKNNFGKKSFLARYAKIEVSGLPGVNVSLEGESQTISEEGIALFDSTAGIKKIRTENIYSPSEGVRYVFVKWRSDNSVFNSPELTINVDRDIVFTLEYRKEYFVNLSFTDKDNALLKPSFYTCLFPNGTFYNGTSGKLWLTSGDLRIMSVSYAGLNVLEEARVYDVYEPKEIFVPCNVLSGTIRVIDPFSTPINGAELTVVFLNNTRKTYVTDQNGIVNMRRIAGERVKLTVNHMGYSTIVNIDFSNEREVTIRIPMSLNIVLIIVIAVSIVAVIIMFKLFSHKIFRSKREKEYVVREEYEFEEI